jgi:hypothetical protein
VHQLDEQVDVISGHTTRWTFCYCSESIYEQKCEYTLEELAEARKDVHLDTVDGNIECALYVGGCWEVPHGMLLLGIRMRSWEAQKPWCCIFGGVFPQVDGGEGDIVPPWA